MTKDEQRQFESEVASIINKMSLEQHSNTPDFIIARHLLWALLDFNATMKSRDGHHQHIAGHEASLR